MFRVVIKSDSVEFLEFRAGNWEGNWIGSGSIRLSLASFGLNIL
jgi:hypothetical protein